MCPWGGSGRSSSNQRSNEWIAAQSSALQPAATCGAPSPPVCNVGGSARRLGYCTLLPSVLASRTCGGCETPKHTRYTHILKSGGQAPSPPRTLPGLPYTRETRTRQQSRGPNRALATVSRRKTTTLLSAWSSTRTRRTKQQRHVYMTGARWGCATCAQEATARANTPCPPSAHEQWRAR